MLRTLNMLAQSSGIHVRPQRANQDLGNVRHSHKDCRGVVFDGHGQEDNIVAVKAMRIFEENSEVPIREIVPKIAKETEYHHTSGSTMAFFETQGDEVEIALLGDSRVVIYRPGIGIVFQKECIGLSDKEERDRVNSLGSKTEIKQEVWRMSIDYEVGLPMSRAFGDGRYLAMLSEPSYFRVKIEEGDYVMAFSDGMLEGAFSQDKKEGVDFFRNGILSIYGEGVSIEEIVEEFERLLKVNECREDLNVISSQMVDYALKRGSTDDTTFLVYKHGKVIIDPAAGP